MNTQVTKVDAEQALLSDMFLEPRIAPQVAGSVSIEAYWKESHRKIARVIYRLCEKREAIDVISVLSALHDAGDLDAVGGQKFVTNLSGSSPSAANWETHAALVNSAYQSRRLDALGMDLRGKVADLVEPAVIAEIARKALTEITVGASRDRWEYVDQVTDDVLGRFERAQNGEDGDNFAHTPTGCNWFDHVVGGGVTPGHSYYIGALYKVGKSKTTLAPIIALARKGWHIDWWSTEMSAVEMTTRMISHISGVSEEAISQGHKISDGQMNRFIGACAETANWKSRVRVLQDGKPEVSNIELESLARAAAVGTEKYCIVIDYLQSVKSRAIGSHAKTHEHVEDCSQRINAIAKTLNIPVIIIYQLLPSKVESRRGNLDYIPVPKPDDCKGGSQMLMDANHVILLHRPYRDSGDDRARYMLVDRAVARAGTRRVVALDWDGMTNQFHPFTGQPPHPFRTPTEDDPRLID